MFPWAFKRLSCDVDGDIDILFGGFADGDDGLFGGGVDGFEFLAIFTFNPLVVDESVKLSVRGTMRW